jgi:nucleotide-binding universal stress UspA family protein
MAHLVMVPLDGSEFAEQAVPLALVLARHGDARIELVLVRSPLPIDLNGGRGESYVRDFAARIEAELPGRIAHTVLDEDLGPLAYPPPATTAVADVLARHAQQRRPDLMVMSTHGRGGLRRAWLGSVADALVRVAPCPVLLVRPVDAPAEGAHDGFRHIVVPLDGSDAAETALTEALRMGAGSNARFTLLRVVSPLAWQPSGAVEAAEPSAASPLSRAAAASYLDDVAARLRRQGVTVSTCVVSAASPVHAILEYAEAHAADLIALSSSGRGGIRRLLLGSVADKLIRSGSVPVLVCNARVTAGDDVLLTHGAAAAEDALART